MSMLKDNREAKIRISQKEKQSRYMNMATTSNFSPMEMTPQASTSQLLRGGQSGIDSRYSKIAEDVNFASERATKYKNAPKSTGSNGSSQNNFTDLPRRERVFSQSTPQRERSRKQYLNNQMIGDVKTTKIVQGGPQNMSNRVAQRQLRQNMTGVKKKTVVEVLSLAEASNVLQQTTQSNVK